MIFEDFNRAYCRSENVWDEMFSQEGVREHYALFLNGLKQMGKEELANRNELAKKLFMTQGITFTVYDNGEGIEKIFPFDVIPRIIQQREWKIIEEGIKQRLKALNIFLKDVYHGQFIIKDGIIPAELVYSCPYFLKQMVGVDVPYNVYTHIAGVDLIRSCDGQYYVLEDNLRTPSGVSYMLENRNISNRIFPNALRNNKVQPVRNYPDLLLKNLLELSNLQTSKPEVVLLTPGIYNSAYFEH